MKRASYEATYGAAAKRRSEHVPPQQSRTARARIEYLPVPVELVAGLDPAVVKAARGVLSRGVPGMVVGRDPEQLAEWPEWLREILEVAA
jgi:hypothetical protein